MAYSASTNSDMRRAASETANDLAGKAAELADKAGRHIDSAVTSAESTVRQVAESGRDVAGNPEFQHGDAEDAPEGHGGRGIVILLRVVPACTRATWVAQDCLRDVRRAGRTARSYRRRRREGAALRA